MTNERALSAEDIEFIDAIVANRDHVEAFIEYYETNGMDDYQIKRATKDRVKSLKDHISTRRLELRTDGVIEQVESYACTYKELIFVREYLMNAGKKNRVSVSYKTAYLPEDNSKTVFYLTNQGQKLLKRPRVKKAIDDYLENLKLETAYDLRNYELDLIENREKAEKLGQVAAMNTATIERGKIYGYGKSDKDLGGKDNPVNVTVQSIEDVIRDVTEKYAKNPVPKDEIKE